MPAAAGQRVTYTVVIQNPSGQNPVNSLRFRDALPTGWSYVGGSSTLTRTGGSGAVAITTQPANGCTGTCTWVLNLSNFPTSATATLTFAVDLPANPIAGTSTANGAMTVDDGQGNSVSIPAGQAPVSFYAVTATPTPTATGTGTVTPTATPSPTPTPCTADPYEAFADDTNATTNTIGFGSSNNQPHNIYPAGDVDYARLSMTAGHTYTISVTGVGSSLNARIRLYDTDGVTLLATANANGAGGGESVAYTPTTTGVRYIMVDNASGTGGCPSFDYTLSVTGQVTLAASQDNTVRQLDSTINYGAVAAIGARNDPGRLIKGLVQFDLSSIPTAATVNAANMTLRTCTNVAWPGYGTIPCVSGSGSVAISTYRMLVSWSEATSTWNQRSTGTSWNAAGASGAGTDYNATILSSNNVSMATNTSYTWSITTAAQAWVSNASTNFGLLLARSGATTADYRLFNSSEAGSSAPSLVVTYS